MSLRLGKVAVAVAIMLSSHLFAQEAIEAAVRRTDQQAYCDYVLAQAQAQRDLLRTPSVFTGITQPSAALPTQAVWGITASVSDIKKSSLTMDVARKNCDVYGATTTAQQDIQYALPGLEKEALQHRLELIQQANDKLDPLIDKTTKMLEVQNVTRPMLFALQTTRIKLASDKAETESKIATIYMPAVSDQPIKDLVTQKQESDAAQQKAVEKLSRQDDWDLAFSVGARQQINPLDNRGAYGAVTLSYNLASHAINKHLDQAANAYTGWKRIQEGDVTRNATILQQQVKTSITAQQTRLKTLHEEQQQVEDNLQQVNTVDTTTALQFQNQLISTQVLLDIEIGDASFRLDQMRDFLERNY